LVNKASEDTLRSGAEIRDDIARTQQQIADLQQQAAAGICVGTHIDDEINNLRLLQDELAGVDRASRAAAANGVGAMASLVNSANAAIDKAVAVNRTIQSMQDKTITITTVYQTSGGPVTVHRPATPFNGGLSTNPVSKIGGMDPSPFSGGGASSAGTIPTAQMINVKDFLSGTRAAGGPVDAGSTYMVGEHGPEIVTMAGAGNVSSASSTANILTGGASVLKSIEENTFQTVEEIKRSVGYLDTMEKDGLTAISLLRAIQTAIGSSASAGSSYSGGSSSSGGGGMGGSTSQPNPFRYVGGVFYPGNGGFNAENYIAWEKAKQSQGFATGGAIHPGDTQKVEAWKRPDEAVAFFRPEQRAAVGDAIKGGTKTVHMTINMPRSGPVTRETKISDMEAADRFRRAVRDELGAL
jgi:hypothetical protein